MADLGAVSLQHGPGAPSLILGNPVLSVPHSRLWCASLPAISAGASFGRVRKSASEVVRPWEPVSRSRRSFGVRSSSGEGPGAGSVGEGSVAEAVSPEDEEDQAYVREIKRILELLKKKRDMTPNEVRLTVMIEDPREVERRKQLGVDFERGCSREDMGNALAEVLEGKVPSDRLVLRELAKELGSWPNLEEEFVATAPAVSPYAKVTKTGVDPKVAAQLAQADWDAASEIGPGEGAKNLSEVLPPAVGFSFLYLVSGIPIVIGVVVVVVLFLNSLQ